jgi:thiol-disulfide isomerase/thioredoxin
LGFFLVDTFLRSHSYKFRRSLSFAAALAYVMLAAGFLRAANAQTVEDIREPAKDTLLRGQGKVQVFVFVRTDCPIANRYAPLLQQMQKTYGQDVTFRLVFPDKYESVEKIRGYLREYRYALPALRDVNHALVKKTGAKVTPEAAVFNANGDLIYHGRIDNLYEHLGQARRSATTHELAEAIEAARRGVSPAISTVDSVGCFISDME